MQLDVRQTIMVTITDAHNVNEQGKCILRNLSHKQRKLVAETSINKLRDFLQLGEKDAC